MKLIKRVLIVLSVIAINHQAYGKTTEEIAKDLFESNMHGFLVKNCSECHGEGAIYPVGPTHSHSDPEKAFEVFKTKVENFENIAQAKIWRIGSNKHHCREFQYNCENEDAVSDELKMLLTQYEQNVKTEKEKLALSEQSTGMQIDANAEKLNFDFNLITSNTKQNVVMKANLIKMGESDYYMLEGLYLKADHGMYQIKNINIYIDGRKMQKQTGFERTDRVVIFSIDEPGSSSFIPSEKLIDPYQPMLEIKTGQKLDIRVELFEEVFTYENLLCNPQEIGPYLSFREYADEREIKALREIEAESGYRFNSSQTIKEFCFLLASEINIKHPRRSVIFRRGEMTQNEASKLIHNIYKWIDAAGIEQ